MSQLFGFSGDHETNPKHSHINAPFSGERFKQKQRASFEVLPDECHYEIFRRLSGQDRSCCACVSKRWLYLLSNICREELKSAAESNEGEDDGHLSRSLKGKKATDVRLAAIAVGTATRGGLGELSIRSSSAFTNVGLKAIAIGCPFLKVFSLWNLPDVGDEDLSGIANGCQILQKLDLTRCPAITDKGLLAIAKSCPNLTDLAIESCANIENEGLQAVGEICTNLKSVLIKDCPGVVDQGIAGLVSFDSTLSKVKLQELKITDKALAAIGHYGKNISELVLSGLPKVTEVGLSSMANGQGLHKLKSVTIRACQGTDAGLEALGKSCPNLKYVYLRRCLFLSEDGLVSFAKAAGSLESLLLDKCPKITGGSVFYSLSNVSTLKAFSLVNCEMGFNEVNLELGSTALSPCKTLRSLSICNCPGFGDVSLALLRELCSQLRSIELSGLQGVTDVGVLPLVQSCEAGLVKVNLSGCVNLTDNVVFAMTKVHGCTLEILNLQGCSLITDASLISIAENCLFLSDLDVSKCAISDFGISILACSKQLKVQILSLSACSMISDKSLPSLIKLGQTLIGLDLRHCTAISGSTVDVLVEKLFRCDIIS